MADLANQELDLAVAKWAKYFGDRLKTLVNIQPEHKEEGVRLACGQVLLAMRKNHDLLRCSWDSVQECVQHGIALQLNMSWGPLGEAALVPYKSECTLIIGFKGLHKLARRGGLKAVDVDVHHEKDHFRLARGPTGADWEHRPFLDGDPGSALGYYCNLRFPDGFSQFTHMSMSDVMRIAEPIIKRSTRAEAPWKVHFDEMAKKTVLRRALKLAGMDEEMGMALALSDAADERQERDMGDLPRTTAPAFTGWTATRTDVIDPGATPPEAVPIAAVSEVVLDRQTGDAYRVTTHDAAPTDDLGRELEAIRAATTTVADAASADALLRRIHALPKGEDQARLHRALQAKRASLRGA